MKQTVNKGNWLSLLLGGIAFALLLVFEIVFGFTGMNRVVYGIFKLIIIGLPVAGGIVDYLKDKNLVSFPMIFNFIVLVLTFMIY